MSRPDRLERVIFRFLVALVLVLSFATVLTACEHTITLSNGEERCEYQNRRSLDAESLESVRTIIVDAAGGLRSTRDMVTPQIAEKAKACDGQVCLWLDEDGCSAVVRR